jgi:hypothetical protein
MVYNTTHTKLTQHPPPATHCLYMYIVCLLWEGGEVGEVIEKVEGQRYARGVENTNMTDCFSSLVYKLY